MAVGVSIVLIIQMLFCLIPYSSVSGGGIDVAFSIFKDQPAVMLLSVVLLALAIISRYKEKLEPVVYGAEVLYAAYFIVRPIVTMIEIDSASFSPIACILLSIVAIVLSIKGIISDC